MNIDLEVSVIEHLLGPDDKDIADCESRTLRTW